MANKRPNYVKVPIDSRFASKVQEFRAKLDELPHGQAKKLIDAFDAVLAEATWLQSQRDFARQDLQFMRETHPEPENDSLEQIHEQLTSIAENSEASMSSLLDPVREAAERLSKFIPPKS